MDSRSCTATTASAKRHSSRSIEQSIRENTVSCSAINCSRKKAAHPGKPVQCYGALNLYYLDKCSELSLVDPSWGVTQRSGDETPVVTARSALATRRFVSGLRETKPPRGDVRTPGAGTGERPPGVGTSRRPRPAALGAGQRSARVSGPLLLTSQVSGAGTAARKRRYTDP